MKAITFQSIFDTPAQKLGKLNELAVTPDGRIWRYLYATEAITQHMVVSRPANTDVDTVSSSTNARSQIVYVTEASAGWTVGAYQDHWLCVDDGTGEGQIAKIKDNTTDTLELYEDYAFSTAMAVADSDIVIVHEPDAEKAPVTTLYTPLVGVAQVTFASADYGYFLVRGIGGVLGGAAMTLNRTITPGDDTEGTAIVSVDGADLYDISVVGRVLCANTTADKAALVDINLL